jgi:opacity protein-like surface antigen
MRSKLAISALVVASLFGATAIASAQTTPPAPGASGQGEVGPGTTAPHAKSHKMKTSKMKSGTTTGMSRHSSKGDNASKSTDKNGESK